MCQLAYIVIVSLKFHQFRWHLPIWSFWSFLRAPFYVKWMWNADLFPGSPVPQVHEGYGTLVNLSNSLFCQYSDTALSESRVKSGQTMQVAQQRPGDMLFKAWISNLGYGITNNNTGKSLNCILILLNYLIWNENHAGCMAHPLVRAPRRFGIWLSTTHSETVIDGIFHFKCDRVACNNQSSLRYNVRTNKLQDIEDVLVIEEGCQVWLWIFFFVKKQR